ncbi:uncharacterized protein LOC131223410 [Magnolia sinica]|uniref:uncharacterized protein LOC131223410 n=1 Tax=Magnolia sinica TaxID=86752 RepID=UPI00265AACD9|nr:uncharacterized protein LOC131223410 [Magnolia sinica]
MAASKDIVAVSAPSQTILLPEADSQLSALIYDVSQQAQAAMENMLKMINEIDQSSVGIMEEIEKCKESAVERKKILEDEKGHFQKAAFTVLEMLNAGEIS